MTTRSRREGLAYERKARFQVGAPGATREKTKQVGP